MVLCDLIAAALSERERAVAQLLLEGAGEKEAARILGVTVNSVKLQKRRICRRARIPNDQVSLVLLLLGYARAEKKRPCFRRELLLGFRRPGRPVGVRDSLPRNRLVKMGLRDREDGTPVKAKMAGLTKKQSQRLASLLAPPKAAEITPPLSADTATIFPRWEKPPAGF